MNKFNENLEQFIKNLSKITKDNYSKFYDFSDPLGPGEKYLISFYKNCKNMGDDIANKNEIIFSEENVILENINFNKIWNSDKLNDEGKKVVWNYLHTLYIFAYEHIKKVDIKDILKQLKKTSPDSENLDADTKTLINIINTLTDKFSSETNAPEEETEEDMSFE